MVLYMVMMANLSKDPKWVDGQFGKALEFDGTKGEHVIVPINDTLQLKRTVFCSLFG